MKNQPHYSRLSAVILTTALTCGPVLYPSPSRAQDAAKSADYVPREEYERLKKETDELKEAMQELRSEVKTMKQQHRAETLSLPSSGDGKAVAPLGTSLAELQAQVDDLKGKVKESFPGSTKFLLAGYGSAGLFVTHGSDTKFSATFNPIFLWKMSDRLLFEGELELELEGGETSTALEMAQLSYTVNDYLTVGAGKFLNPTDYFVERQHMAWVNKLPDKPLAVYDGLMPEALVGAQVRGVVPLGPTKLEYAAFISNAPHLVTSADNFEDLGTQEFDNFDNTDGHFSLGAHVGFIPIPQIEVGYGFQRSTEGPRNGKVHALLQSADFNYVDDSAFLKGVVNFRAQYVWSTVGTYTYDADGSQGFGPIAFSNRRDGGYIQLAYRPSHVDNFLKDFEPVVRYDMLNQKRTPTGFDESRVTFGLNYWLGPSTVVKAAYELDSKSGIGEDANAFMLQFATGF